MAGLASAVRCDLRQAYISRCGFRASTGSLPKETPKRREIGAASEITAQQIPTDENSSAPAVMRTNFNKGCHLSH